MQAANRPARPARAWPRPPSKLARALSPASCWRGRRRRHPRTRCSRGVHGSVRSPSPGTSRPRARADAQRRPGFRVVTNTSRLARAGWPDLGARAAGVTRWNVSTMRGALSGSGWTCAAENAGSIRSSRKALIASRLSKTWTIWILPSSSRAAVWTSRPVAGRPSRSRVRETPVVELLVGSRADRDEGHGSTPDYD